MQQTPTGSGKAAVLGAGTMGTALASAIAAGGRPCTIWCESADVARHIARKRRHPRHFREHALPAMLSACASIGEAVSGPDLIIVCVGSDKVAGLAVDLPGAVGPRAIVLSATKGLEPELGIPISQLLARHLPKHIVGAISGPNIATDIVAGRSTPLVVASPGNAAVEAARRFLEGPSLRIFGSSDLVGVEMLGALKNVVVVAMGLAEGLGLGDNARAYLLTLGMLEVHEVVMRLGGRPETLTGLAGIGDVFLSATAGFSRNHMVGVDLGKGRPLADLVRWLEAAGETAEGINTVRLAARIADQLELRLPLVRCMHAVLFGGENARAALTTLLGDAAATRRLEAA